MTEATTPPTFYPYFGYRDAAAALRWLAEAFGFEIVTQNPGPDDTIAHAEMRFGNGAIMLGSYTEEQLRADPQPPIGHGIYVFVEDVDAHFARAQAAGARIVYGPEDTPWGTRRYRCLDPEGYEWSFGTYRPAGNGASAGESRTQGGA